MLPLLPALALAGSVTLHVGVPTALGTPSDVQVRGADEACTVEGAHLTCPATGPVRFSWPGPDQALWGSTTLAPGETGRAWVLAAEGRRGPEREALRAATTGEVDRHDLARLRELLVFTSAHTPPWPSPGLLEDHLALLEHPDPRIRREAMEGLFPWVAGTPFDPLPVEAPVPVDAARLAALARDADKGVRRRLAHQLRTARPDLPRDLVAELLETLLADPHPGVRRAALVALPEAVDRGAFPARAAWERTLALVPRDPPPGRAACNVLGRLRAPLERAGVTVDPAPALAACLEHHPERAWRLWTGWREALPVDAGTIRLLLERTVGINPSLVRHWHTTDPSALAAALEGWSDPRHPERDDLIRALLDPPPATPADPAHTGPPAASPER